MPQLVPSAISLFRASSEGRVGLYELPKTCLLYTSPATDRRDLDLDSLGGGRGKIILDGCGENLGIGSALNKAVVYARDTP